MGIGQAKENCGQMSGRLIGPLLALAALAAAPCAWGAEGPLGLHPDVLAAFEHYRQAPRPGAFAVSQDGASFGTSLCDSARCDRTAQRRAALDACRRAAGTSCVILASGSDVRIAYRVLTREEISVCPLAPTPRLRVILTEHDDRFERSQSLAQLSELLFHDERHWIDEEGSAMGVTEHVFDIDRSSIDVVETEGRGGVRCVGYQDGEIVLTLGATIYVASEIPEDSCLFREVLAHERKHRTLGSEMTREFARDLEAAIASELGERPFAELPHGMMPWKLAEDRLDRLIGAAYAVFRREHSRHQLAIDSNSEYRRVQHACPGETEKYAR